MESDGNRVYRVLQGTGDYNVLQSTGLYWGILGGGGTGGYCDLNSYLNEFRKTYAGLKKF